MRIPGYGRVVLEAGSDSWMGMLGSKRKARVARGLLADDDGLPADAVEAIESPVGLSIGAATPAEIAVSILARIIDETRGA
ncbi:MAG: XdhC family protein [Myxococcota bacterium]